MYKVLIADDEEIIRRGVARLLQKDPDFCVVAEAEDGEMALELASAHLPDLLLVDINMPFLNGLEFIEKLGDLLKNAVIIVITGYDQFAYAQQALRLKVFDYLLKPLSEPVFFDSIKKAKDHLARHGKQVQYLNWAKLQIEKYRPALCAEFTRNWLKGYFAPTEIQGQAEKLSLTLPERETGLILFRLTPDSLPAELQWDDQTLYYAAENIAREVFSPCAPVFTAEASSGDLALVCSAFPEKQFLECAADAKRLLQEHLPVKALQVAKIKERWADMPHAMDEAEEEMELLKQSPSLMRHVRAYMDAHFMEEQFSLQEAAENLHVSPQHLSRVFRRETGITFMEHVTRLRIRRASELLLRKDFRIYEIAERVGYANQHYFSSAFKKVLGVSPMEYRRSMKKE
ncbi:MAG TPA: response regulator [Feifaniaceae bacterium]|nr:response regulator [Feifaniaceae bacterium]